MNLINIVSCGLLLLLAISDFSSANVRLCGKSLTQFLDLACVDGFNAKHLKAKKSVPLSDDHQSDQENDISPLAYLPLFKNDIHSDYNSLIAKTRRRRYDGVADECCRQPCAMSELLSYCL